jgi:hypothetical protein
MVRMPNPVFVRVTVYGGLVFPTLWLPKFKLVGDKLTIGPAFVRVEEPEIPSSEAVISDVPVPTPIARPVLVFVADMVFAKVHVAATVKSCILPSPYVPIAVNCCIRPRPSRLSNDIYVRNF